MVEANKVDMDAMEKQISLSDQLKRPVGKFAVLFQARLGGQIPFGLFGDTKALFPVDEIFSNAFYIRMCHNHPAYSEKPIRILSCFVAKQR